MPDWLTQLLPHWKSLLGWVWLLTGIYLAARIVLQQRAPVATLAWILVLCLIPPVGLVLHHLVGPQRIKRQSLKRMRSRMRLSIQHDLDALRAADPEPPLWARQHSRLLEAACGIPPASCSRVDRLLGGDATLDAILQAVAQARLHIHLEYYIFDPDHTGMALLQALQQRLADGVKVRLLVDGVGSARFLRHVGRALRDAFVAAGGELAVFHPARLDRWRPLVNLRTHRKIVVVDGRIGFVGGINISDTESVQHAGSLAYRDTHLRLEGAGVHWLQYVFLQDWVYASGNYHVERALPDTTQSGSEAVHVAISGPDQVGEAIHQGMLHAINTAEQRVLLTTPYFVPTEPARYALINAAMRGVDVQVLVPRRSDSWLVTAAARSYYPQLRLAGVKIHEYTACMLHAKTLVVDGRYSMVGTANFDNRSLLLNFEIAVALYGTDMAAQLEADFERDLAQARLVPMPSGRTPWYRQLLPACARLMSPLL